ncbi:rhomboid family intramembrane serine protease [Pseudaminobacter sp. 19-2017]|uniref:Rhomboid family intramembrane serine protease n=1 Tax=Pseudaminobacter soli (ex Zhang et al. 2022) TaxID=2831468 RepID=A0A942DZU3_9HYPH|nr:rhomboid family intramembrane serine protease [Pseudaminobacter soli]MBS3647985.1 rhomboid family intramembrane serine protease [Pseudaminobacter soli]
MFIPLHDANSLKHIRMQYVTIGLIVANVLVFLLTGMGSEEFSIATTLGLGYIPSVAFHEVQLPPEFYLLPAPLSYVTYAFLHADLWHLGGNMLFLWVFGDNVEDALGHFRFLIFYLLCAAGGAALHGLAAPASQVPLIGASGAVAGVVAAYLILHPRVKIWVLAFGRIPLRIPAWIALALWIGFQFVKFAIAGEDEVSWACHIGGILTGALLVLILRRRSVPLLDREVVTPKAVMVEQPISVRPVQAKPGPWDRR